MSTLRLRDLAPNYRCITYGGGGTFVEVSHRWQRDVTDPDVRQVLGELVRDRGKPADIFAEAAAVALDDHRVLRRDLGQEGRGSDLRKGAGSRLENGGAEMKVGLLLIVLVAAQGCAAHVVESVVKSDSRSVIVHSRRNDGAKAQELADAECARYLRLAVAVEADPHEQNYVFKCVDRFGN